jgi:membrane dipeptidase
MMNRRQFLHYVGKGWAFLAAGNILSSCAQAPLRPKADTRLFKDLRIVDAHAHPDQFFFPSRPPSPDYTSTLDSIQGAGMAASSFSAVGDLPYISRGFVSGSYYQNTKDQLKWVKSLAGSGKVKMVLKAGDVPKKGAVESPPGAILAIEGGDPLEGNPRRVDEFYRLGVRMITLVHYRNNELGDIMFPYRNTIPGPKNNGLTGAGRNVVERMQTIGMVVDAAHADATTLKHIAEISSKPLVDSHTSLCPRASEPGCGRLRSWKEMEWIVKTGGVVCTWPLATAQRLGGRRTFSDWAKEIMEMKKNLGMEHVGLGTDGGGNLPRLIRGYRDVRDLRHLVAAMQEVGLSPEDIRLYMGKNICRVLQQCIG